MKINLGKILKTVIVPLATAVVVQRVTTGKIDVKGIAPDQLASELAMRRT